MSSITRRGFFGFLFVAVVALVGSNVPLPEAEGIKTITVTLVLELGKGAVRSFLLHVPSTYTVFDVTTKATGLSVFQKGEERTKRFLPLIEHQYHFYYRVNGTDIRDPIGVDYPLKDGDEITWSAA